MKISKSNFISSAVVSTLVLLSASVHANEDKMKQAYQSTDVKAALINVCKEETAKSKKLTTAEVSKYCTCAVTADGKLTNAQKWEIQSAINKKQSPSTLAFVQKQNNELQACFGPQLMTKLKKLTEDAMAAQQAAKK